MGKLGLVGTALVCVGCSATSNVAIPACAAHATRDLLQAPIEIEAGTWTSAWEAGPFPFDQLLPSWNVRRTGAAAFRVELQVRAAPGAPPSPWFDLGGWGEWPADDRASLEFEGARVAVDLFKADALHSSARLRLRSDGPVTLAALCLCFTRSACLAHEQVRGQRRRVAALAIPQLRQTDEAPELAARICSPTAVNMLLRQNGIEGSTAELAALVYDPQHDLYGNWNRAVQGAFERGLPGHLRRINDWNEVADWLAGGTALIASVGVEPGQLRGAPYTATRGHLLVISGLDGAGGAWVLDPAVPVGEEGPRRYALDDLNTVWLRRGGFAYVLGQASARHPFSPGN